MTRVYPNASVLKAPTPAFPRGGCDGQRVAAVVLTVWRKSLLFNCSGFTVFDTDGNLAFRVDNYSPVSRGEIVLMDAAGKPLLTIRRKKLSLGEHWRIYEGEAAINPRFSVKKHVSLLHSKALAHVTPCSRTAAKTSCSPSTYKVEGSYAQRCCAVYSEGRRELVAEIRPKEATARGVAFGADVFRLVVQPGFDAPVAMAIVILLEQMF